MTNPVLLSTGTMMPLIVEQLEKHFEVIWLHEVPDRAAMLASHGERIVAVCTGAHTGVATDAAMLAALPNLKVIGNYGVGYDSIDVKEAARRGIVITNTPDVLTEEVADTTIGLLIATVREFNHAEAYLRTGEWARRNLDYPFTASLRDRTIGMVGYGRIGKAIGRRLEAFGLPIAYFGRTRQEDVPYPFYTDLVAMARDVDTLIAIVPGGAGTQRIINAAVLDALGPRGIFINMARGTIVDEDALIAALQNHKILAAGLDVFMNEPNIDPRFLELDNVTLLPHVGSASQHTRNRMGQLTVDNLLAFKDRRPPLTPVPETPFKAW